MSGWYSKELSLEFGYHVKLSSLIPAKGLHVKLCLCSVSCLFNILEHSPSPVYSRILVNVKAVRGVETFLLKHNVKRVLRNEPRSTRSFLVKVTCS